MRNVKLLGAAVVNGPLCARSGRFQHLHAIIFREQISLHAHADVPKSSGAFFPDMDRNNPLVIGSRGGRRQTYYVELSTK